MSELKNETVQTVAVQNQVGGERPLTLRSLRELVAETADWSPDAWVSVAGSVHTDRVAVHRFLG